MPPCRWHKNMWCDLGNIWLKSSFGQVHYAENPTWIRPVVHKLRAIEGYSQNNRKQKKLIPFSGYILQSMLPTIHLIPLDHNTRWCPMHDDALWMMYHVTGLIYTFSVLHPELTLFLSDAAILWLTQCFIISPWPMQAARHHISTFSLTKYGTCYMCTL